ncbi:aminoglycoside phosphotransferase family protein [Couchioplanes caeruleus]|uniref:aminoglycoside phosphotransferase family protein n=1 Tax=Couchioplanes caeruleus TaxID=56438 RepID=UPI0020BFF746|nr:aminoglycoside phosphotransferase family protein [Couchioplanes caeruleus]UQU66957.1 aminoglycoside phosphotransferase family protein [Couchioplanes caeruleus]
MFPTVEPLGAGTEHTAYLVNGDLVIRFRRDPAGAGRVAAEARLLDFVAGFSPVPVPRPIFVDPAGGCMAWPRLPGVPLIGVQPCPEVAARLGALLAALHAVPPGQVADFAEMDDAPAEDWLEEARQQWPSVAGQVPAAYRPAVEAFLAAPAPEPAPAATLVFSHHDLGIEHVLVDPGTGAVTGVIDWSDAAVGDPARDHGLILRDLGPSALAAASPRDDQALIRRIWFYARCGLIADLAYGLETGRHEYATKSLTALSWLYQQ